jgi:uncharacterized membrane protein YfcA
VVLVFISYKTWSKGVETVSNESTIKHAASIMQDLEAMYAKNQDPLDQPRRKQSKDKTGICLDDSPELSFEEPMSGVAKMKKMSIDSENVVPTKKMSIDAEIAVAKKKMSIDADIAVSHVEGVDDFAQPHEAESLEYDSTAEKGATHMHSGV